ncbi:hypothetical protein WICPIJ_001610 [Wickerhamomyces pijperi]|uniref:Uncharacterized protein n=1 Tax=Wickerhamomyces pijperi TaxID=599730 RepID=A0A9P8QB93_WICPI|nr:hypothetical protein WICPIJ_001610 [Wickerhamomyces pijperi]
MNLYSNEVCLISLDTSPPHVGSFSASQESNPCCSCLNGKYDQIGKRTTQLKVVTAIIPSWNFLQDTPITVPLIKLVSRQTKSTTSAVEHVM